MWFELSLRILSVKGIEKASLFWCTGISELIFQLRDSVASSSFHYLSPAHELSLRVHSRKKQYNTNLECIKRREESGSFKTHND
ncbi:hypothetical protein MTR67_009487 [Solanum verrucosum]|uniref:Uncharacterized protein n=1 Tax=Solanum verrucosum TaxID=315347 RepID=A0AAF0TDE0_SOLVR|nr:hypothetical protein MTR67_009487 [Solanum verrucosum]